MITLQFTITTTGLGYVTYTGKRPIPILNITLFAI